MNLSQYKNILSALLIFLHLATMVITVGEHNHLLANAKTSQPSIVSHNCGAEEIHKDIDTNGHCLPCFRSQNPITNCECSPYCPETGIEDNQAASVVQSPNLLTSSYTANRGPPSYHTAV